MLFEQKNDKGELEYLRSSLYNYVSGVPSRLSSSVVLKASTLLDKLIIEVQREKRKKDAF